MTWVWTFVCTWAIDCTTSKFLISVFWKKRLSTCVSFSTFSRWIFVKTFGWSRWFVIEFTWPANCVGWKMAHSISWTTFKSTWSTSNSLWSLIPKWTWSRLISHYCRAIALSNWISASRRSLSLSHRRPIALICRSHFFYQNNIIL